MDMAPYADGAAAILLTRSDLLPAEFRSPAGARDRLERGHRPAFAARPANLLAFEAARVSVERACRQAGICPTDVDLFELWDGFSIYAALSLEAACLAPRGEGWQLAQEGQLGLDGRLPVLTMGGQKARGNPLGASGVYQLVEAAQQLRGRPARTRSPMRAARWSKPWAARPPQPSPMC